VRGHQELGAICALFGWCLVAWSTPTTAAPTLGQPATWRPHDLIVSLRNLPRAYSCDDLWYKFRDILLALGARPDIKILVYQCGREAGELARSPDVHLQFSTPEVLTGAQVRWAQIRAAPETVHLAPGQPASLRGSDCELMRQIKDELLPEVTERVVKVDFACSAPRQSRPPFNITVQTETSVATNPRVSARVSALAERPVLGFRQEQGTHNDRAKRHDHGIPEA
jgi:hypothetical protein